MQAPDSTISSLVVTVIGIILTALFSAIGALTLYFWREVRSDVKQLRSELQTAVGSMTGAIGTNRSYQYNNMRLMFTLLAKLNPASSVLIAEAMSDFMRQQTNGQANGQSKSVGAGN